MNKKRIIDFSRYSIDTYLNDIDNYGMKETWNNILPQILEKNLSNKIFCVENFGELYEIGLEHESKINKKEMGKYYTPKDVSIVMSKWLISLNGKNICDVGCGVGNLVLTYLETIGKDKALDLIKNEHIYLYDIDEVALEICRYSIAIKYGKELLKSVKIFSGDFLSKKIKLPKDCKVISNPPYFKISIFDESWEKTKVITDSKELYSSFMEKIIKNSKSSVIITPYSFIGCQKFYSLRKLLNNYNGFIVSFDNVPGNIFSGRKHGIFNTNSSNSVRAAITVVENQKDVKGFKLTPLIRFKTDERKELLNEKVLTNYLGSEYQIVTKKSKGYYKCFKDLEKVLNSWNSNSNKKLGSYITNKENNLSICIPTTCRYFTVGSSRILNRTGNSIIYVKEKEKYSYVYCLINSTFGYWYWRLYDGGIN